MFTAVFIATGSVVAAIGPTLGAAFEIDAVEVAVLVVVPFERVRVTVYVPLSAYV
jgi:hypothetical protein